MLIGKVLRIGYISREKVSDTNTPKPQNVSANAYAPTVPVMIVKSLLELNKHADETYGLDNTRVLTKIEKK